MAVNIFPAPTASSGLVANRPRFTLSNTYTLTHSAGVRSYHMDAAYHPSSNSILIPVGSGEGTQLARWVIGSGSLVTSDLPIAIWNDTSITVGFDGNIYTARSQYSSGSPVYKSTNLGVNWSSASVNYTHISPVFPLSNKIIANGNSTDVVPVGFMQNGANAQVCNATTGTDVGTSLYVSLNEGNWTNVSNPARWHSVYPIRKGDDDFAISGYIARCGQGAVSAYTGSHGLLSNPVFDDFRGGGLFNLFNNESVYWSSSGVENKYKPNIPGRWTPIENRWMLLNGPNGQYLFDLESNYFTGSPLGLSQGSNGSYTARPIYISSTKKLYMTTSTATNTLKIREFDVTFE